LVDFEERGGVVKEHRVRVAAIAVATVDGMVRENYARALRLGEIALDEEPDIILFPEAFAAGYCGSDLSPYAEALESEFIGSFRTLSGDGGCMVVFGFLMKAEAGLYNACAVFDRAKLLGLHCKSSLWVDEKRPYRDEPSLMLPGKGIEVFDSRFGRFAVLICYENTIPENWDSVAGSVDFVLSPYNCQGDPSKWNIENAGRLSIPSAWADRTGTVFRGEGYGPNLGTAGIVNAAGDVVAESKPGVEAIVVAQMDLAAGSGT